ncbi:hypothetical protein E3N88_00242 [Mikania micrantha]|uniref:Endonuclease/exonuclease/phosphatase domain-containing protein n=1 Tax=Mikania micrantha TaxID=192012 RepID=A0A5N6PZA0_9ASTR|nr:hypothetical protein E3N88_00242 [Mikania micrantha]
MSFPAGKLNYRWAEAAKFGVSMFLVERTPRQVKNKRNKLVRPTALLWIGVCRYPGITRFARLDIQVVRIPWENVGPVCAGPIRDPKTGIENVLGIAVLMQYKDYHPVDLAGGNHTVDLADWYWVLNSQVKTDLFEYAYEGKIRLHVARARARSEGEEGAYFANRVVEHRNTYWKTIGANGRFKKMFGRGKNGVAFLVAIEFQDNIVDVRRCNNRIMLLRMMLGEEVVAIVIAYAPHTKSGESGKRELWDGMDEVMRTITRDEKVCIGGYFNRHIGRENDGFPSIHGDRGFETRNESGRKDNSMYGDTNTIWKVMTDNVTRVAYETLGITTGKLRGQRESWWWNNEQAYFNDLFNNWDTVEDSEPPINRGTQWNICYCRHVTKEEVQRALRRMKKKKVVGPDNIPNEAYDGVPHQVIWNSLERRSIPWIYIYARSKTSVRAPIGETYAFLVEMRLQQGSTLSPFLFAGYQSLFRKTFIASRFCRRYCASCKEPRGPKCEARRMVMGLRE